MKSKRPPADKDLGSFRPNSYWEDNDPLAAILRNVKGANRRQMITDYWNAGRIDELDPDLLADKTDPGLLQFLERLHPSFMGGEYLPDLLPAEVEIARISLQSTTFDVISIRARRKPGSKLIHYRIVDEYETDFEFEPTTSNDPLSHDELVALIDGANGAVGVGLALCFNEMNFEGMGDAESLRNFTTVSSLFYPDLEDHYEAVFDRWVEEKREACDEQEENEESE
jgi:hypothetical protein